MSQVKVYFDNCAYNRPFDDQQNIRIAMETQAKLYIQTLVVDGRLSLVWSYVSTFENENNPYENKKVPIRHFARNAQEVVTENQTIIDNRYMRCGLGPMDSLHLASALYAGVDYFITTDDSLLRYNADNINIISPVEFVFRWTKGVIHD